MPRDPQPNRPELGRDFTAAHDPSSNKSPDPINDNSDSGMPELDHLDLAYLDYTPGGTLEQSVHTSLSENSRREYRERMERNERSDDDERYELKPTWNRKARETAPSPSAAADRGHNKEADATSSSRAVTEEKKPTSLEQANEAQRVEAREAEQGSPTRTGSGGDRSGGGVRYPGAPEAPENAAPYDTIRIETTVRIERASRFDRSGGGHEH
jgi:hypothetical protein